MIGMRFVCRLKFIGPFTKTCQCLVNVLLDIQINFFFLLFQINDPYNYRCYYGGHWAFSKYSFYLKYFCKYMYENNVITLAKKCSFTLLNVVKTHCSTSRLPWWNKIYFLSQATKSSIHIGFDSCSNSLRLKMSFPFKCSSL